MIVSYDRRDFGFHQGSVFVFVGGERQTVPLTGCVDEALSEKGSNGLNGGGVRDDRRNLARLSVDVHRHLVRESLKFTLAGLSRMPR